jgi:hypothetical protein
VTNGISIGDEVQIGGTYLRGKVIDIDDHPLEYAELQIEIQGAAGPVTLWKSCRLARKL